MKRGVWSGACAVLASALLISTSAFAEDTTERFDHRGSIGVLLEGALAYKAQLISGVITNGARWPLALGATWSIGPSGNELTGHLVESLGGGVHDEALALGYRSYFGPEQIKTYLSLELGVHVAPAFTVGPRVGFGLQYDFLPTCGAYLGGVADLGAGHGIRFSAELLLGLQLRSYLLEG